MTSSVFFFEHRGVSKEVLLNLFVLLSGSICVLAQEFSVVSVQTNIGEILGQKREQFTTFLGIPFGDVNDNDPLTPATPHPNFETPFEAFTDLPLCPQLVHGKPVGTIHCLQLNVYTPNDMKSDDKLPVLVYIHGGGYIRGESTLKNFSPKFLVRHNVIMVVFHYRVGAYGFLCPRFEENRNLGIKDQILALRWVKNTIKYFGGDDENITIMGESAGSISVDVHLLYTKGLFQKAILESGHAAGPPFVKDIEYIQASTKYTVEDKEFDYLLATRDAENNTVDDWDPNFPTNYRICFDSLIKKTPTPDIKDMKILIGTNEQEGLMFYPSSVGNQTFTENFNYTKVVQDSFFNLGDVDNKLVKNFYLQNGVTAFVSDFLFNYPLARTLRFYLKNNATVYRYLFKYDGGRNFMKVVTNITSPGTAHGDELGYLFDIPFLFSPVITEADQRIIDRITLLWTNFAKYGDPTPTESDLLPEKWLPTTEKEENYFDIGSATLQPGGPFEKDVAFWDMFYHDRAKDYHGINLHDI